MKRKEKRTIISFEATDRDIENLTSGRLKRGGISTSQLLRDLLEADRGSKVLTVVPAMAPPKDLKAYINGMKALEETIEYVAEIGLPNYNADSTAEDRAAIEHARALFAEKLKFIDSEVKKYVLFGRLVAAIERCKVDVLKAYVKYTKIQRNENELRSRDLNAPEEKRKQYAAEVACFDEVLEWFRCAGLLPPDAKM